MKELELTSPIKVITSNTVPTIEKLGKGELAYGIIAGKKHIYGNVEGNEVIDFSTESGVGPSSDLTPAANQPVEIGGTTDAVTATFTEKAVVEGGGLYVTPDGKLDFDEGNITISLIVMEI